jgi:DNA repair exonuclease SbcCD ATPase subunit
MDLTEVDLLAWLVPAAVVFGSAAVLVVVVVLAVRFARRGPAARRRAAAELGAAGAALVQLDDAVDELDLEVGLSGALYGGGAPPSLRRARMTAQHARDEAFIAYRDATDPGVVPADAARAARDLHRRIERALATIETARREHRDWIQANIGASEQVAGAERHLAELRARMGDPAALLRELEQRADPEEWTDAARAVDDARSAVAEAERRIAAARAIAADPTRSALDDLAGAERALRRADAASRTLEETHRLVTQAGLAVGDEIAAARSAIRSATSIRAALPADEAERLGEEIRRAQQQLDRIEPTAARRPVSANEDIARVRDRLDMALADAHTAQQRLHGARTALPGTLAAARSAIGHAEAAIPEHTAGLDARVRLDAARRELAAARQTQDPVEALDAARRAIRHAEDAKALADHHRLASAGE